MDDAQLTITNIGEPAVGTLTQLTADTVRYHPKPNYNGEDSFAFGVADKVGTVQGLVRISVEATADLPEIKVSEDPESVNVGGEFIYSVEATDADPGDTVTITLDPLKKPGWLTIDQFGNGLATVHGVPSEEDVGRYEVTIIARDSSGGESRYQFMLEVLEGVPLGTKQGAFAAGNPTSPQDENPPVVSTAPVTTTGAISSTATLTDTE